MPKYRVTYRSIETTVTEVEAEDEDAALEAVESGRGVTVNSYQGGEIEDVELAE